MLKAFISYSHKDKTILDRLHTHLATLIREQKISGWYDREILAGNEIDKEISHQLETCNIFIALVSADFIDSSYCYEKEMQRAIKLSEVNKIRIVAIIARPCDWKNTPLVKFKVLPNDGVPITKWPDPDDAYLDIVNELRRISEVEDTIRPEEIKPSIKPATTSRYRVKKMFDEIDKNDFKENSYKIIRGHVESFIREIGDSEDLKARFSDLTPFSFTCTPINKARRNSVGHLTVHAKTNRVLGDIIYSYSENAGPNTSNGSFSVGSNDFEMFLTKGFSMYGNEKKPLNAEEAALMLWKDLMGRADVVYS
jgi:hypothetical protein